MFPLLIACLDGVTKDPSRAHRNWKRTSLHVSSFFHSDDDENDNVGTDLPQGVAVRQPARRPKKELKQEQRVMPI